MTTDPVDDLRQLVGRNAVDPHGDKIGTVTGVYVADDTGEPTWLALTTGWFGTNVSFVPFEGAYLAGDELVVAYQKDIVKGAPNCGADRHLNVDEEHSLYDYYELLSPGYAGADRPEGDIAEAVGAIDQRVDDDAMTRSEEELAVSKHRTEVGRARLRRWIETEYVNITVPIRREKARLVIEPVGERNVSDMVDAAADLREVTLSEEEIEINTRVVPKERVRLEKVVETEEVPVDETIRRERIAMDQDPIR